eukprot:jgi/Ulvmu1/701/UM010_0073.1
MKGEHRKPSGLLKGFSRLGHSKSRKQLAPEPSKWDDMDFPTTPDEYEIQQECGRGVSATVYQGICKTNNEKVAIKKLDLDEMGWGAHWEEVVREAHTMAAHHHPNLLPLLCSFTDGNQLWMVEPYITHGSMLNIMKYAHPHGLSEELIAVIAHETLRGLDYLHHHGMIHRDVKCGNILVDADGRVYLADFGVAAPLEVRGAWGEKPRNTFVGTPCWMAPEVMQESQYDFSADIWSLGITVLELAHGHAPFAKYPPFKVVMMTVQNPPPSLDSEPNSQRRFSKELHDLVASCLQKDPAKRPTARALLEHRFFKHVPKDRDYMRKHLMAGLPDVITRVRHMKDGVKGLPFEPALQEESRSNDQYVRGLSAWNFDVAELKRQAQLEPMEPLLEEEETGHADRVASTSFTSRTAAGDSAPMAAADGAAGLPRSSADSGVSAALPVAAPPPASVVSMDTVSGALASVGVPDVAGGASSVGAPLSEAGDAISRGASHTGEFALPSTALSSSPGQLGPTDHAGLPHSPYSNPPSQPPSNPPTSNAASDMHEEDDLAQATIGHSIAQASPSTCLPHSLAMSSSTGAPAAAPADSAAASSAAALSDALGGQPLPPGSVVAVTTSVTVATTALPVPAGSPVPAGAAVPPAEQVLPPTEVNIARHTHALAATVGPPPPQQKVGRFNIKKKMDLTASDNGSAATMPEWRHGVMAGEDAVPRPGPSNSPQDNPLPMFDPVADRAIVEGAKAASVAGMPIGDKDETSSRKSSKKGRFNVTAATMPLQRSSVNLLPAQPESERSLTVEALTALDTDPAAVAASHVARVTCDSDIAGRLTSDGAWASPAHTSSTHGEADAPAAAAAAAAAANAAAASVAVSTADAVLEAALTAPLGKDLSKSRKESRFKVVKVVDGRLPSEPGGVVQGARTTSESAAPQPGAMQQGVSQGGISVNGAQQDALGIVNKKLQELMQANQAQQEALRMVTAAVSEGAKGKDLLLSDLSRNPLVAVHLLGSESQHNALLEENARLRAELEDLKRKTRRDSEKNKALTKEKELLRSHVAALREQLEAARGVPPPIAALPPDLRTSAPLLTTPTPGPGDSRTSSPSGSILAAAAGGGGGGVRLLPLDMAIIGSGGVVAGAGAPGDMTACSGSSSTTPQELSPWPGGSSQSGEVGGGARYMPPVCPSTSMAMPTPVPAAAIRSPFAGTQHMMVAGDAPAAAAHSAQHAHLRPGTLPSDLSSLAQMTKSTAAQTAPAALDAGVPADAGPAAAPAATAAAAVDVDSAPATRPLSPVAEGAAEGSASSATGQADSMPGLPMVHSADHVAVLPSCGAAAAPAVAGHDRPAEPAS